MWGGPSGAARGKGGKLVDDVVLTCGRAFREDPAGGTRVTQGCAILFFFSRLSMQLAVKKVPDTFFRDDPSGGTRVTHGCAILFVFSRLSVQLAAKKVPDTFFLSGEVASG